MRRTKIVTMLAACAALAVLVPGCKQASKPQAPPQAVQAEAAPQGAPAVAQEPAKAEGQAQAVENTETPPSENGEAPAAEAPVDPTVDREKLSACYQEVYCAQKKGQMDKILDIYKTHGFETPQDFTKAWIEAAKDTDWITRIANSVAKKCP